MAERDKHAKAAAETAPARTKEVTSDTPSEPLQKFVLKHGTYQLTLGNRSYTWAAKPGQTAIVQSNDNLAERWPEKFGYAPPEAEVSAFKTVHTPARDGRAAPPGPPTEEDFAAARQLESEARAPSTPIGPAPAPRGATARTFPSAPAEAAENEADDGLDDNKITVADLESIAEAEEVDLSGAHLKADKIEAIRKARRSRR